MPCEFVRLREWHLRTGTPGRQETQRDCEELSAKMLRQSQVNEDLEQKLANAKVRAGS